MKKMRAAITILIPDRDQLLALIRLGFAHMTEGHAGL